jgi:Flp pilus assembly pilin Flp
MLDRLFVILRTRDDGQTMAEYGVVIALITVLVFAAFAALSGGITGTVDSVREMLPG